MQNKFLHPLRQKSSLQVLTPPEHPMDVLCPTFPEHTLKIRFELPGDVSINFIRMSQGKRFHSVPQDTLTGISKDNGSTSIGCPKVSFYFSV